MEASFVEQTASARLQTSCWPDFVCCGLVDAQKQIAERNATRSRRRVSCKKNSALAFLVRSLRKSERSKLDLPSMKRSVRQLRCCSSQRIAKSSRALSSSDLFNDYYKCSARLHTRDEQNEDERQNRGCGLLPSRGAVASFALAAARRAFY